MQKLYELRVAEQKHGTEIGRLPSLAGAGPAIDLLAPVVAAQMAHILESRVLAKTSPRFTAPFEHGNAYAPV